MGQLVKKIPFPHTSIGPFISCLKDYFNDRIYDFKFTVVGTYHKAIQAIEQKKHINKDWEKMGGFSPILSFTPQLIEPVVPVDLYWKYSNLHPYQVKWNQAPLFRSGPNMLHVITRRMLGNVDFRIFCDSLMEVHDVYLSVIDGFRGLNKVSHLPWMKQYLVVSDEIRLFQDDNNIIAIDWEDSTIKLEYFPGINKDKYYIPLNIVPQITLQSFSDSSSFFGGGDLPEYSLQGNLSFEMEIPVLMTIETAVPIVDVDLDVTITFGPDPNNGVDNPNINVDPDGNPYTNTNPSIDDIGTGHHQNDQNELDELLEGKINYDVSDYLLERFVNVLFLEREPDENGISKLQVVRVFKEYFVEVNAIDVTIPYPVVIPNIPWLANSENTVIFLFNREVTQWQVDPTDPYSIILLGGFDLSNKQSEIKFYHFKEMKCSKKKGS